MNYCELRQDSDGLDLFLPCHACIVNWFGTVQYRLNHVDGNRLYFGHLTGTRTIQNIYVPQSTTVGSETLRSVGASISSTDQPLWCILTCLTPSLPLIIFLSFILTLLNVSAGQATVVTSTLVTLSNLS